MENNFMCSSTEKFKRGRNSRRTAGKEGFTLVELLIVIGILTVVLVSVLELFIYCSTLVNTAGNKTLAVTEAQAKIEEMRTEDFLSLYGTYNGDVFTLDQLDGIGVINMTDRDPDVTTDLYEVEVSVVWRNKDGRVVGEDENLDGLLDAGEDANGNGVLDYAVTVSSHIARR